MGHVSGIFLGKLGGLLPPGRAAALGLSGDGGPRMIPDTAFLDLLERIAAAEPGGRSIAVRLGASMCCDDYGAFGLAFKTATDLLNSFRRVERYGRVVTSIANYRVVESADGGAFMAVRNPGHARPGEVMATELAVAAATAISREVCRVPFDPVSVHFSHAAPDDIRDFEAHFRCPVRFGSDRDGLAISAATLQAGNRLGDAAVSEFLDGHLERELAAVPADRALEPVVRAEIERALSDGVPGLGDVARRMGMSVRTLQRRMAEEGIVYRDLAERTRLALAERLLGDTDYALSEVAFLTGYAEQSTFSRAFKRRNGSSPAAWRRARHPDRG
ncbi:helix-turn-helix domain-containing protein [Rhodobacterales bacterium HKCCE2091]|nr:helix-turn-helix domain-containing protein [Rhodobacterales bacterium HKCCE2091]